jgi:type II secretory pathway pseudopilin PulG
MWSILKSKCGFSIIEMLIAFALLGGTAAFTINLFSEKAKIEKKTTLATSVLNYRASLIQTLRSSDALLKTAKANGITCLEKNVGCSSAEFFAFTTLDGNSNPLTDKTNGAFGFSSEGQSCTSFPSTSCPFRFETKLKIICVNPTCSVPQFKVRGNLMLETEATKVIVAKNNEFEITLGQGIDSYERGCTTLGGTYQPGDPPSCLLAMNGNCPKAADGTIQVVVGYDLGSKQKICKPIFKQFINNKTCASGTPCTLLNPAGSLGEVMVGVDLNGDPICKPMKLNPGCATACDSSPSCVAYKCQLDPGLCPPSGGTPIGPGDASGDGGCGDGAGGDGCDGV